MRTIKQYLEAAKARKENGEAGFSLVELIVVVVILGILAAVAIPIFNGIQARAQENAIKAAVANYASQAVANVSLGNPHGVPSSDPDLPGVTFTTVATANQVDSVCVSASGTGVPATGVESGPGC